MKTTDGRRQTGKYPFGEKFAPKRLTDAFEVRYLISLHYFEFAKDFIFSGERHDFWELIYADKGEIEVVAAETGYRLKQGDMMFVKPNDYHSLWANRRIAPNLLVVSFVCRSRQMKAFENRIFCLQDHERGRAAALRLGRLRAAVRQSACARPEAQGGRAGRHRAGDPPPSGAVAAAVGAARGRTRTGVRQPAFL